MEIFRTSVFTQIVLKGVFLKLITKEKLSDQIDQHLKLISQNHYHNDNYILCKNLNILYIMPKDVFINHIFSGYMTNKYEENSVFQDQTVVMNTKYTIFDF
ncbi:Hypothetical protein CINCED_3A018210 [Cinara cedri]|uniref:Uncharacterized protein n=1 Tax=Cinara cedri TaxID=506608 RepID=A0A5E4M5J0_9HEMI|nr:Hypothetical protein CINCED_3A018210 [Cinara cedri]